MEKQVANLQAFEQNLTPEKKQWMAKVLIIGTLVGAVAGIIGAIVFVQNNESKEDKRFNAATGLQLGLGVLGVLRLLSK